MLERSLSPLHEMMGMDERRKEDETPKEEEGCEEKEGSFEREEEEGRRACDVEAIGKIVRMVTLLGSIQGSRAQGKEEEEGSYVFGLIVVMAVFGSVCWTAIAVYLVRQAALHLMKKQKEDEKWEEVIQEDEVQEKEEKEAGEAQSGRKEKEDPKESGEEERKKGPLEERAESSQGRTQVLEYRRRRTKVVITPWGSRWHSNEQCPTLHNTKRIMEGDWCHHCTPMHIPEDVPVYSKGPGRVVHYEKGCRRREGEVKKYAKCQICVEAREKKK